MASAHSSRIKHCRSCGHTDLGIFLDLGCLPIADGLVRPEQLEEPDLRFSLETAFCTFCSLVQILETVSPELLFCNSYPYYSSVSDYWLEHNRRHAEALIRQKQLGETDLVVEVASNDGYMLRNFACHGIQVLGIDPAEGPAEVSRRAGIETLSEFFTENFARKLRDERGPADLIIVNNVLAHVANSNDFVRGLRALSQERTLISIEVPYVRDLIEQGEFDTIYHQHLCYFSLASITSLLGSAGLHVNDVVRLPSHGGSLRVYASTDSFQSHAVDSIMEEEKALGLSEVQYYRQFAHRVSSIRDDLNSLLASLKNEGMRIAGYGAAAKACTLLNFCDIGPSMLDFIVDRNEHKHGLFMPGIRLPIVSTEQLLMEQPEYVLLLCWNLEDEVLEQQSEYRSRGGKFIVPLPELRVVQ